MSDEPQRVIIEGLSGKEVAKSILKYGVGLRIAVFTSILWAPYYILYKVLHRFFEVVINIGVWVAILMYKIYYRSKRFLRKKYSDPEMDRMWKD